MRRAMTTLGCRAVSWRSSTFKSAILCVACLAVLILGLFLISELFSIQPFGKFEPSMNADETKRLLRILLVVMTAFDGSNVSYWMNGGTLLGSFRHHGPIPWDDDVDLLVASADKDKVLAAVEPLQQQYGLHHPPNSAWRFYERSGSSIPWHTLRYGFRFPVVDLLFYADNETHVWSESYSNEVWLKSAIFPLRWRPFGPLWAPAPCDVEGHLTADYPDLNQCQTTKIGHRNYHAKLTVKTVDCRLLMSQYPFVKRTPSPREGFVTETLMLNGQELQQLTLPVACAR